MDNEFWLAKWQRDEIGFHLNQVNPNLLEYWPALDMPAMPTVLVPLCGKSEDVLWLRQQGCSVIGIELSEIAIQALVEQCRILLNIELYRTEDAGLISYQGDGIVLIQGDIFSVTADQIGPVDWVYDRAAVIAMPAGMRADYAQQVMQLSQYASQLLISLEYDQAVAGGPPFSVTQDDLEDLYAATGRLTLTCLGRAERIDEEPRFKSKGLTSLVEAGYQLSFARS